MLAPKACGRMRPACQPSTQRPARHARAGTTQGRRGAVLAQVSTNGASATGSKPAAAAAPKKNFTTMEINGVPYIRIDEVGSAGPQLQLRDGRAASYTMQTQSC